MTVEDRQPLFTQMIPKPTVPKTLRYGCRRQASVVLEDAGESRPIASNRKPAWRYLCGYSLGYSSFRSPNWR